MQTTKLPLYFSYTDVIFSAKFFAGVRMVARVTAEQEGDEWWFNGVNPGAIAECGADRGAAALAFRSALKKVLFSFAAEAASFEDFKLRVEKFFHETDDQSVAEWSAAREAVRAGAIDQPDFRRETGDPTAIQVELLQGNPRSQEYAMEDQPRFAA